MKWFTLLWTVITKARPVLKESAELYEKARAAYEDKSLSKQEVRDIVKELVDVLFVLGLAPSKLK